MEPLTRGLLWGFAMALPMWLALFALWRWLA